MHTYDFHFNENRMSGYYLKITNAGFESLAINDSHGTDMRKYYLMLYVSKGKGTLYINDSTFRLEQHAVFLIPPDTSYEHRADEKDPWILYWVGFQCKDPSTILRELKYTPKQPFFYCNDRIEDIIVQIYYEMRRIDCNYLLLDSYLLLIFSKIIQSRKSGGFLIQGDNLQKACTYINSHIHEKLKVGIVAKESCGINVSQLYRIFMNKLGMSPHKYIQLAKIEKACELIRYTDMSFHDIAQFMGYEYDSQFFQVFKQQMLVTPSEYRSKMSEEPNNNEFINGIFRIASKSGDYSGSKD